MLDTFHDAAYISKFDIQIMNSKLFTLILNDAIRKSDSFKLTQVTRTNFNCHKFEN